MRVRMESSSFSPLLFSTHFLPILLHSSVLATDHCFHCSPSHSEELSGQSVPGGHAMSSKPGNLLHHTPLVVCILRCYKTLFSPRRLQNYSNFKGGNGLGVPPCLRRPVNN